MIKKKSISLFLCATLLLTILLTGCGSNSPNNSYEEPDSDSFAEQYDGNSSSDFAPNKPDTSALVDARNSSYTWAVTYTEFTQENDYTLIGYGYVDAPYNDFFDLKGNTTTYWVYNYEQSAWMVEREYQDYYGVLTRNIEGSFKIHNGTSSRIHVRNQTETSMEVLDTGSDKEWVKVDLDTAGSTISGHFLESGRLLNLTYVGYLADGEKVTVTLSEYNDLQITVNYQYEMFDSWGYWETFTPAD